MTHLQIQWHFAPELRKELVMRSHVVGVAAWRAVVLVVTCLYVTNASAATQAERTKAAAQLVADALRQEIQGTDDDYAVTRLLDLSRRRGR